MANNLSEIILEMRQKMVEFAERAPAKGMHINYWEKAVEIMELYGDAIVIMHEDRTPENETKVSFIAKEIIDIVG